MSHPLDCNQKSLWHVHHVCDCFKFHSFGIWRSCEWKFWQKYFTWQSRLCFYCYFHIRVLFEGKLLKKFISFYNFIKNIALWKELWTGIGINTLDYHYDWLGWLLSNNFLLGKLGFFGSPYSSINYQSWNSQHHSLRINNTFLKNGFNGQNCAHKIIIIFANFSRWLI